MIYVQRDGTDEAGQAIKPNGDWFQLAGNATRTAWPRVTGMSADLRPNPGGHQEYDVEIPRVLGEPASKLENGVDRRPAGFCQAADRAKLTLMPGCRGRCNHKPDRDQTVRYVPRARLPQVLQQPTTARDRCGLELLLN